MVEGLTYNLIESDVPDHLDWPIPAGGRGLQ